jgi:hypothetical protein
VENKKDILEGLKKAQRPVVPDGFFNQFWIDLMQRIEQESGVLGQLKKAEKPAIPEDFFSNLTASFSPEDSPFTLENLQKSKKPTLPVGYFDESADRIMEAVKATNNEDKKGGRIINMRMVRLISLVAATIAIVFTVIHFSSDPNDGFIVEDVPENNIPEIELTVEDNYDDYLVYLDEDEIIDYIIENDIEIEDTVDVIDFEDYSDFSEEDIEEYYLDLL